MGLKEFATFHSSHASFSRLVNSYSFRPPHSSKNICVRVTYTREDKSFFGEMKKLASYVRGSEVCEFLSEKRLGKLVNLGKSTFFPHLHNSNKTEYSQTGIFQTISISQRERRKFGQRLIFKEEMDCICGVPFVCLT